MARAPADRRIAVGGFITSALLLFLAAIIIVSGQEGLLKSRFELRTRMDQVSGLKDGAPVWLAGVSVGSVTGIYFFFDDSLKRPRVEVRMKVKSSYRELIRSNSKIRIGTLGLLGDKYLAMTLGDPEKPIVKDGDYLESTSPVDFEALLQQSSWVIDDATKAVRSAKEIVTKINKGTGTIGLLVNNPILFHDLKELLDLIENVGQKVARNEGTIGRLFNESDLYVHLDTLIQELAWLADTMRTSKGTFKKFISDTSLYVNINSIVTRLDTIITRIEKSQGTLGAVINERELYDALNSTISSVDSIVQAIKEDPGKFINVKVRIF